MSLSTLHTERFSTNEDGDIFQHLFNIAENVQSSRTKLHSEYLEWCRVTEQTVDSIFKLQQEILKHNHNSNCVSLGGTCTSIVGCIVGIASAAIAVPTAGLGLLLPAAAVATLGGAVSAGSSITSHVLSTKLCEKAKDTFDKNIELTEQLEQQKIQYFDLLQQFKVSLDATDSSYLLLAYKQLELEKGDVMNDAKLNKKLIHMLVPTVDQMNDMRPNIDVSKTNLIIESFSKLPELIKLIKGDRIMLDLFSSAVRQILPEEFHHLIQNSNIQGALLPGASIKGISDTGVGLFKSAVQVSSKAKVVLKKMSTAFRVGMGILNAVFLIWGIVDLTKTSINIHKGSPSVHSDELGKVANQLKEYRTEVIGIMKEIFEWEVDSEKTQI